MAFMETHQEVSEPNNTASASFKDLSTKCLWQLEKTALSYVPDVWEGNKFLFEIIMTFLIRLTQGDIFIISSLSRKHVVIKISNFQRD